jgi:hypothetical protein
MKKTIASIVLGIALSAPVAYAACADLIVIGTLHCALTGSAIVGGLEHCYYACARAEAPAPPAPVTPPAGN